MYPYQIQKTLSRAIVTYFHLKGNGPLLYMQRMNSNNGPAYRFRRYPAPQTVSNSFSFEKTAVRFRFWKNQTVSEEECSFLWLLHRLCEDTGPVFPLYLPRRVNKT